MLAWVGLAVLAVATWRLWRAALREWRYAQRVRAREARVREDVCWQHHRREAYIDALRIAYDKGYLLEEISR